MSDDILLLSDRDKVRQRPGMYIGDNDKLGLATIVREVIDNAVDEYPNYPDKSKPIEVILHGDNSVSVRDYGRGISPYKSTKPEAKGEIQERLAYTRIGAGGKFDQNRSQNGNQYSAGLNGTGSAATNFMSEFYDVTIWRDGYKFHDRFEDGGKPVVKLDKTGNLPKEKLKKPETGTLIHFKADKTVMTATKVDASILEHYFTQTTYLNPGLTMMFKNERDGDEEFTVYHSENGLLDYVDHLSTDEDGKQVEWLIKPFVVSGASEEEVLNKHISMEANIAVGFPKNDSSAIEAFTNGVYNSLGGTHVNGVFSGLVKLLRHYYTEFQADIDSKNKKEIALIKKTFNTEDIMSLIKTRDISKKAYIVIDFKHSSPVLQPQTKDKLASLEAKTAAEEILFNNAQFYLDKNINVIQNLINTLIKELYEKAKEKQADVKQDESVAKLLVSTKLAATRHIGPKAELFIVEGDSAAGTLKANRDSNYQAILPLRGKVLNSQKATSQKVLDNLELSTLIATLGCGFGDNFDITKLRYGKIIIATDQDVDGLHIRCLLLTFFMNYMPELILQGYVYFLDTPLFVNEMKGKNQKDIYTYSDAEQAEVMKKYRGKIADTLRNKGLGELSEAQAIETILEEKTRKLTRLIVNDEDEVYALIDLLMGDNTQGRKNFFTNQ